MVAAAIFLGLLMASGRAPRPMTQRPMRQLTRLSLIPVGISGQDAIVGINQGSKLRGAIKTAERKLADGSLRHSGQGLMAWAVANARVEPKGNAIVITKQASGSAKIDPLMAAFNAIAFMASNPISARPNIFWI